MKPMDIMDALTDMDDVILLLAQLDPPKKHNGFHTVFRNAAACLVCVMMVTALLAPTIASETGLRWSVEYQEDGIVWSFKDGNWLPGPYSTIAPTWQPSGYTLVSTTLTRTFSQSYGHWHAEGVMGSVFFQAMNVVDQQSLILESFPAGTYQIQTVTVGNLPGEMYTYLDDPDSGELIWVDKDRFTFYRMTFQNCDAETVLKMAESVEQIG